MYKQKYLKYKKKYLNLKSKMIGGNESIPECETSRNNFAEQIINYYKKEEEKEEKIVNQIEKGKVLNLITNAPPDNLDVYFDDRLKSLFTPNNEIEQKFESRPKKYFPIWWSGFYIEDKIKRDEKRLKNITSKLRHLGFYAYSSLDIVLSKFLENQNKYWKNCYEEHDFNYGTMLSTYYTRNALANNPKHLGLFVSKDIKPFKESFFYRVELPLILKHFNIFKEDNSEKPANLEKIAKDQYIGTNKQDDSEIPPSEMPPHTPKDCFVEKEFIYAKREAEMETELINFYIFNKKNNSEEIKGAILERVVESKSNLIKFHLSNLCTDFTVPVEGEEKKKNV